MAKAKTSATEHVEDTTNGFAARWQVDYQVAVGVIKYLTLKGIATKTGEKPNPTGRGKGSAIYSVPTEVMLDLKGMTV